MFCSFRSCILIAALGAATAAAASGDSHPAADLIVRDAHIWTVNPAQPQADAVAVLLTLYAATTRATLDGKYPQGWYPEQKLTIQEAIAAYTMGSAHAEFQEHDKGSIEPGKLADMVLLSQDVLTIAPAAIRDTHVLKTWVGGVEVYDATAR